MIKILVCQDGNKFRALWVHIGSLKIQSVLNGTNQSSKKLLILCAYNAWIDQLWQQQKINK